MREVEKIQKILTKANFPHDSYTCQLKTATTMGKKKQKQTNSVWSHGTHG
jgi:hypothetical protein